MLEREQDVGHVATAAAVAIVVTTAEHIGTRRINACGHSAEKHAFFNIVVP